jgi:hypothetical protein
MGLNPLHPGAVAAVKVRAEKGNSYQSFPINNTPGPTKEKPDLLTTDLNRLPPATKESFYLLARGERPRE